MLGFVGFGVQVQEIRFLAQGYRFLFSEVQFHVSYFLVSTLITFEMGVCAKVRVSACLFW